MGIENDMVIIKLGYTPKKKTLKNKFGNLPVKYMKTVIDSREEFNMLEKACQMYEFNKLDEDEETDGEGYLAVTSHQKKMITGSKRPIAEKPEVIEVGDEEEADFAQPRKARKRIQPVRVTAQTSADDEDDDNILSQVF